MDNKKITLKQTVTDKDGNQQIKTISTYTDEAILASETNINEKISANAAEIENLKAQGSTVNLLPLKQIIKNGTYSAVDDNVDGYAKVAVNIPSYPFVVTDVGTYYPKDGYLFDSVTVPDITLEKAFKSIGYTEIPEAFNASIEHSKELASKWNPNNTSVGNIFSNEKKLIYAPYIDTSNVTNMNNMFTSCSALTTIPLLDTSNVTSMGSMFTHCTALTTIPALDTSNVTNMNSMFENCSSLTTIPILDTSNVTNMDYMFENCSSLNDIPQLDTSNVTNMSNMFLSCTALTTIPALNTSNVTGMYHMFAHCTALTTIPALDTSNVTNMNSMFTSCSALTTIPLLNTSKVTNMNNMFNSCYKLTAIPALNTSNVTSMDGMFHYCWELSSILMTGTKCSFSISATALGHDALVTLLNNLGTANSGATLTMGSSKLALLSDEEKKIATDKGWILA